MKLVPVAPSLFVSHGSPTFALDAGEYGRALEGFGEETPRPAAIVIVSAS